MNTIDIPAIIWRKSRYSNADGNCVEVATRHEDPRVAVRDSKDPAGPVLTITPTGWHTFTTKIKAGQLG